MKKCEDCKFLEVSETRAHRAQCLKFDHGKPVFLAFRRGCGGGKGWEKGKHEKK